MSERRRAPLSLRKKILFALVPAGALLVFAEGLLRLLGYQSSVADPYESFVFHRPLFETDGHELRTNPARTSYFHRQRFPRSKPPGVQRYFAFGGSDTYGWTLPDSGRDTYPAELARRLEARFAPTHFEVINCGGLAYASYRLLGLVEECLEYQPDLMIVMSGHNEFLEPRRYASLREPRSAVSKAWDDLRLVRLGRDLGCRLAPLARTFGGSPSGLSVDFVRVEYMVRDEREFQETRTHYVWNLNRMADRCREHGTPVIFCTSAANLRNWSPSLLEPGGDPAAADRLRRLAEIRQGYERQQFAETLVRAQAELACDPRIASLHYTAAQCLDALGRTAEAKREYVLARDTDAFPHRALSSFNEAVRALVRERQEQGEDVELFDAEAVFARAAADGIPGNDLFHDQCHPNLEGHRLLAQGLEELIAARRAGPR
jgi:lysophospholipase L1-like esterase